MRLSKNVMSSGFRQTSDVNAGFGASREGCRRVGRRETHANEEEGDAQETSGGFHSQHAGEITGAH